MATVAIIGASRGIGFGLVERYAGKGWRVHATTRNPKSPGPLGEVAGEVHLHGLEVTDVLIHNAGVYGDGMSATAVHRVNADAPIEMAELLMMRGRAK